MRRIVAKVVVAGTLLAAGGCAEREMTVISDPPGATVFMDGVEKGVTPVTYKFDWYGGRRFLLKRDGYETCEEIRKISPPLHMKFPLDTVWDLTPLPAKDHKTLEFKLVEQGTPNGEELRDRAEKMRVRAYEDAKLKMAPGEKPPQAPAAATGTEAKPEEGKEKPAEEPGTSPEAPGDMPGPGENN